LFQILCEDKNHIRAVIQRQERIQKRPLHFPFGSELASSGLGNSLEEPTRGASPGEARMVEPSAYVEIKDAAILLAGRISEVLKDPRPDKDPAPVKWGGLYTFRREMRTLDAPLPQTAAITRDRRSLAIYLLVDCLGSIATCWQR
jgi:hypothetical protein